MASSFKERLFEAWYGTRHPLEAGGDVLQINDLFSRAEEEAVNLGQTLFKSFNPVVNDAGGVARDSFGKIVTASSRDRMNNVFGPSRLLKKLNDL